MSLRPLLHQRWMPTIWWAATTIIRSTTRVLPTAPAQATAPNHRRLVESSLVRKKEACTIVAIPHQSPMEITMVVPFSTDHSETSEAARAEAVFTTGILASTLITPGRHSASRPRDGHRQTCREPTIPWICQQNPFRVPWWMSFLPLLLALPIQAMSIPAIVAAAEGTNGSVRNLHHLARSDCFW